MSLGDFGDACAEDFSFFSLIIIAIFPPVYSYFTLFYFIPFLFCYD